MAKCKVQNGHFTLFTILHDLAGHFAPETSLSSYFLQDIRAFSLEVAWSRTTLRIHNEGQCLLTANPDVWKWIKTT